MSKGKELKDWFFRVFWNGKPRISQVSGRLIGTNFSSAYYHHILPKNKWPELTYVEENIVILTMDEHQQVEAKEDYYPIINERRIKLLEKYGKQD